jgi:hypothetical protein
VAEEVRNRRGETVTKTGDKRAFIRTGSPNQPCQRRNHTVTSAARIGLFSYDTRSSNNLNSTFSEN